MTFSVVAHQPSTGTTAAAVASHFPGVGAVVPWVSHRGGVATQAVGDPRIGRDALGLIADHTADRILDTVLRRYGQPQLRQITVVRADSAQAHTGQACMTRAGHALVFGDDLVAACAGNICTTDTVWTAMADALRAADPASCLVDRVVAALLAGHGEGGDLRGQMAVALAAAEPGRPVWQLRCDAADGAVLRLPGLVATMRAYEHVGDAVGRIGDDPASAARILTAAAGLVPGNVEVAAYRAAALAAAGDVDSALQVLEQVDRTVALELLRRVDASGWIPVPSALLTGKG